MEFFIELPARDRDVMSLHQHLNISSLPQFCSSIETVISDQLSTGEIYCLWGHFQIHRELLKSGVRFSLPACPNALVWTVTRDDNLITVHCTINKAYHDQDFVSSIERFMADWEAGLQNWI